MRATRLTLLTAAIGAAIAIGAASEAGADDEVSTVDVLAVLEEINRKLDRDRPAALTGAPDTGFGGGPFLPLRYLPAIADLNAWFGKLGSYGAMSELFYPIVHGGAGTWRWSFDGGLQIGAEYGGFAQDVTGFAQHTRDPLGPRDTVDADGDGYDDYYSYAGYGQGYVVGIVQYKWPVAPQLLSLHAGVRTGLAFESVRYGMDRRQVLTETLGITSGSNAWSRTSLIGGVYAGAQIRLDGGLNLFKLGIEAGVNGHYAIGAWAPATGVHERTPAPPDAMQAHHFWFAVGPQFHY